MPLNKVNKKKPNNPWIHLSVPKLSQNKKIYNALTEIILKNSHNNMNNWSVNISNDRYKSTQILQIPLRMAGEVNSLLSNVKDDANRPDHLSI